MFPVDDMTMLTVNIVELHLLGFVVTLTIAVLPGGEVYDVQINDVQEEKK
ncbi:MAG: hypothetical protein WBI18_10975 [Candidatus Saccharicenans sp.]